VKLGDVERVGRVVGSHMGLGLLKMVGLH
jgi:hypothetical protein